MANENGAQANSLNQRLQDKPYEFDFFQAVRRIECEHRSQPLVGHSKRPQEDPVRFAQNISFAFAPAALAGYEAADDEKKAKMLVNFFGLLGSNGPMPLHITEYIRDRLRNHDDRTLASFLDIFNHRLISLFYRAWACNQQNVSYDRKEEDRFAAYIGSLFGIGEDSFRDRDAISDVSKLYYSGRLVCQTKNAEGLQKILEDYFGIPVDIEQFVGQWIKLAPEYRCKLGQSPQNGTLGCSLIAGSRVWECQQKFRIKLGPMDFSEYQRMLPGGDSICRLTAWVKNYIGDELSWEVQLILKSREVPKNSLGSLGQLGWSIWLSSKGFKKDVDDLILRSLVA